MAYVAGVGETLQVVADLTPNHTLHKMMSEKWEFRPRKYPHFDDVIMSEKKTFSRVSNKDLVAKHAFLPFILEIFRVRKLSKIKKNPNEEKPYKDRPIRRASHQDTQIFSYYRFLMMKKYNKLLIKNDLDNNVIAYRRIPIFPKDSLRQQNKCNINFAKDVFDKVVEYGSCCVMTFDIKDFFESLDHDFLYKKWCKLLQVNDLPDDHKHVFRNITRYSVVDWNECLKNLSLTKKVGKKEVPLSNFYLKRKKQRLCSAKEFRNLIVERGLIKKNKDNKGIPQGSPISDLLANLYMIDFDTKMRELEKKYGGYYRRYSDDILWLCKQEDSNMIKQAVMNSIYDCCGSSLNEKGEKSFTINSKKTTLTNFFKDTDGLRYEGDKLSYLGFTFDGKTVFLRDQTMSRWKMRTAEVIKSYVLKALKESKKSGKSIRDHINFSQLCHKANIANDDYEDDNGKRETNFMTYCLRAKKIFNTNNCGYKMSDSQVKNHKKFIKKRLEEELKVFPNT